MSVIKIDNITKDYGSNKGVFNLSFSVEKGEVLGFLGPNGAGKTTTIRQLMGFIKPDSGTLKIDGKDCFHDTEEIHKKLGYLPGEIAFMDDMNGIEFIKFIANLKGMKDLSYAHELMDFFELDPNGKLKRMSKGMKQKIGIICAFMQDPEILILDEPTSGLDPLMQSKFVELILDKKAKGKTILMSSHIFEEVEKTCDRAVIIKEGKIVAIDSIESLCKSKKKTFELRFFDSTSAQAFSQTEKDCTLKGDTVFVSVSGDINDFLNKLTSYKLRDLNISTQTLEELFMHFYGSDK